MKVPTYSEVMATWVPRYKLQPRPNGRHRVYYDDYPPYDFIDCEWVLTKDSQEEGLLIFQQALEAAKIHEDAKRSVSISIVANQLREQHKAETPKVFTEGMIALTICPDSGDHNTMIEVAKQVATLKCVNSGKYVIEQRSEPGEDPHGWHLHFLIKSTYAPSQVKQYVQQKLKKKYNCTYYATKADNRWEENYMQGNKHNTSKDAKVQQDRILRQQLGLQDIYTL